MKNTKLRTVKEWLRRDRMIAIEHDILIEDLTAPSYLKTKQACYNQRQEVRRRIEAAGIVPELATVSN